MTALTISFEEGERCLDWLALTDALEQGHTLAPAEVADSFLYRGADTLLSRSAWIDGLGIAVKAATVFPGNKTAGLPSINGGVTLYSDGDGRLEAVIDFHLVTKWKTAGDSLLAARKLAPPRVETILIVGAGTVGSSLRAAYAAAFPKARFLLWNRSAVPAARLAAEFPDTELVTDLAAAVAEADIVTAATMTTEPVLQGAWFRPGQHIDLIGAYRPDMREADDTALRRARIFVDSRDTTLAHIGELKIPLETGVIAQSDICASYRELDQFTRSPDDITLFKNGGGAHLDLMVARYILDAYLAQGGA